MDIQKHLTPANAEKAEKLAAKLEASIAGIEITDCAQPERQNEFDASALREFADLARGGRARIFFTILHAMQLLGLVDRYGNDLPQPDREG